jgi:lysophospholipase L1-like esterase
VLSSRANRYTTAAAYGGAGVGAAGAMGAAFVALLIGQTKLARYRIPQADEPPPVSHDTIWAAAGVSRTRPPISLAMLGDSTAAGFGVTRDRDTPAARLAIGLSNSARRPVHVTNVAVVGAESNQLAAQIDALGGARPELAVIMIGANDVTHRVPLGESVRHLADAVTLLRARGAEVVVGTCPDLGTVRPLAQPLRLVARHLSRRLAKQQTIAVVNGGGRTVSLGDLIGPTFAARHDMFAEDRFHPSAKGYAEVAGALLPSCLDALGMRTRSRSAGPFTTRLSKPIARAAAQAASHPGTEVAATERHGLSAGRRGAWAKLRRRQPSGPLPTSPELAVPVAPEQVPSGTA